MAVRDRNLFAWQAYVLASAIVSVGLLAGMFFVWRSYSDLSKKHAEQKTQLSTARNEFATSEDRVNRLLSMAGYGTYTDDELSAMANKFANDEILSQIEKDFAVQMQLFPPSQPASEKNLIKLPEILLETIRRRNEQIDNARKRENELQAKLTQRRTSETSARADAVNHQKKAENDLETTRQDHAAEIAKLNGEKDATMKQYQTYKREYDGNMANLANKNQTLTQLSTDQAATIAAQQEELLKFKDLDFAAPQGEIQRVANGGTEVWINLGKADGLRIGVPFSVIDESVINTTKATPKAQLVIVRIIGDHQSFARVENFDFRRTIVPGDKVYSPAWRAGRSVGFALVGMMDMNGDGKDDVEQVRALIRISGGTIDEEMNTKGVRSGPGMTPNTSFLITGTDLTLPANAGPELRALQIKQRATYAKFVATARQNGIMEMSLDKLTGYLKTEGSDRTVPLGDRIRGEDFPIPRSKTVPSSRGSVSEIFTQRHPK